MALRSSRKLGASQTPPCFLPFLKEVTSAAQMAETRLCSEVSSLPSLTQERGDKNFPLIFNHSHAPLDRKCTVLGKENTLGINIREEEKKTSIFPFPFYYIVDVTSLSPDSSCSCGTLLF